MCWLLANTLRVFLQIWRPHELTEWAGFSCVCFPTFFSTTCSSPRLPAFCSLGKEATSLFFILQGCNDDLMHIVDSKDMVAKRGRRNNRERWFLHSSLDSIITAARLGLHCHARLPKVRFFAEQWCLLFFLSVYIGLHSFLFSFLFRLHFVV